jgi:hypothetical protein
MIAPPAERIRHGVVKVMLKTALAASRASGCSLRRTDLENGTVFVSPS